MTHLTTHTSHLTPNLHLTVLSLLKRLNDTSVCFTERNLFNSFFIAPSCRHSKPYGMLPNDWMQVLQSIICNLPWAKLNEQHHPQLLPLHCITLHFVLAPQHSHICIHTRVLHLHAQQPGSKRHAPTAGRCSYSSSSSSSSSSSAPVPLAHSRSSSHAKPRHSPALLALTSARSHLQHTSASSPSTGVTTDGLALLGVIRIIQGHTARAAATV